MNHVHRIVWNEQSGSWVAVPETARSRGKGGGRSARKALAAALIASGFSIASTSALGETPATTVVPANGNTQAYISANGVPVVDIAKANATGLSHNVYNNYNVEANGLVLNNGNTSQMNRQSQLAGQVPANLNLVQEAKVILNEVVSTNRSALNGFTEVVGGKADVIVANPYGITCGGCGFINTDRVTLTTGTPNVAGYGALTGFTVNGGDVLIQGAGVNASAQQIFDIVARSVRVDGQVNVASSGDLGITTGTNQWDYASRNVTGAAPVNGAAPSYAIDSTALGGMYAGRIRIIATEAGVGVRMLGEAAASADDFTLSSAGKIEVQSAISAARDLSISSTSATGAGDLFVNGAGAKISASHDLSLSATNGQVKLSEGELYAANNLTLTGATLSDVSTAAKTRFAGANSNLITSGAASIDGGVWGAGSALSGTFNSLSIGANGATIYAGTTLGLSTANNLSLATAAVRATGDLTLAATAGTISTSAGADQGIQTTAGNLSLTAGNGLTNAGTITADLGSVTARVNGTLNNQSGGRMYAYSTLDIADKSNGGSENVNNSGQLIADGRIAVKAATLHNQSGARLQAETNSSLTATNLINDGTYIASTTDGQTGRIDLSGTLVNNWILHSGGSLAVDAASVSNSAPNGAISALNTLTLNATAGDLINDGALYARTQLTATATGMLHNRSTGDIDSSGNITLSARDIANRKSINAATDIEINAVNSFVNAPESLPAVHDKPAVQISSETIFTDTEEGAQTFDNFLRVEELVERVDQEFDPNSPSGQIPQIVAGQKLTINYGNSGENKAALLSAGDLLTIAGTGTFTNQSFDLESRTYSARWLTFADSNGAYVYVTSPIMYYWYAANAAQWSNLPTMVGTDADLTWDPGSGVWAFAGVVLGTDGFSSQATIDQASADKSANVDRSKTNAFRKLLTTTTQSPTATSAGIHASYGKVDISGGNLVNRSATGGDTAVPDVWAVNALLKPIADLTVTTKDAGSIAFVGLTLTVPSNLNGLFVAALSPGAGYLVETNPLFAVGSSFVGSDYMLSRYGYNPDDIMKRLGDSNYEAYLIRQQLIAQTGNNIIKGYGNEASQMKQLMDQALNQSQSGGFTFGQALTPDQIAKLDKDVVWMVETTVAGQKVLAPVVYLAASTRSAILSGAVISGQQVAMDVASLTNTGGTIFGAESLDVLSQGDITNTSGTLGGGKGSLVSTEGSIINETLAIGGGDDLTYVTTIGNTGSISFTGDMKMLANKDIVIKGANVEAGTDGLNHEVSMVAEDGTVSFDTIVDKTTRSTSSSSGSLLESSSTNTTTTTERNIGSVLRLGTQAGQDARVAANAELAKSDNAIETLLGDVSKLIETRTANEASGVEDGDLTKRIDDAVTSYRALVAENETLQSRLDALPGTNLTLKAGDKLVVRGADVNVSGDADIFAKNGVDILDAQDTVRSTSVTTTQSYLTSGGESDSGSDSDSGSASSSGRGYATADAQASASAEATASGDFKLSETTVTTTSSGSNTSVASNFNVGGNTTARTEGTLRLQGSNLGVGGNLDVDAKDVEVLAGRNEEWSNTDTTRSSIGIYSEASASAEAGANAGANAGTASMMLPGTASASAGAAAEAEASATFGSRTEQETEDKYALTHSGSSLTSGRAMNIQAQGDALFVGANVESGTTMDIVGTNIINRAAQDETHDTASKTTDTKGLYADVGVSAEAKAGAAVGEINVGGAPAGADAAVEASMDASAGMRVKNESSFQEEKTTTQVVSNFKSGGSMTRKATDTILDQGTQLDAGGDFAQEARAITEIEANNTTYSSSSSSLSDLKAGVGAGASAAGSASTASGTEFEKGAGAGLRAKYENTQEGGSESSSTAVTTRYKSGGSITSKSVEATTLIGTQFEAAGDTTIEAGSLDYKAARDTYSRSSDSQEVKGEAKVDVYGAPGASASGTFDKEGGSTSSSTARTGSINTGGNLVIKTQNDASFEGTQLAAGNSASIDAGGTVDFKAARDTASQTLSVANAALDLSSSKSGGKEAGLSGGYNQSESTSSTARTGSIQAGEGGIKISAGKDANFEGTDVTTASGGATVTAGGTVNLLAAKSTSTGIGFGVSAGVQGSKTDEGTERTGSLGGNLDYSNQVTSKVTTFTTGGKTVIEGKNVVSQEAAINAAGGKEIIGKQTNIKAETADTVIGFAAKGSVTSKTEKPKPEPKEDAPILDGKANPRSKAMQDKIDRFEPGNEADSPVLDGKANPRSQAMQDKIDRFEPGNGTNSASSPALDGKANPTSQTMQDRINRFEPSGPNNTPALDGKANPRSQAMQDRINQFERGQAGTPPPLTRSSASSNLNAPAKPSTTSIAPNSNSDSGGEFVMMVRPDIARYGNAVDRTNAVSQADAKNALVGEISESAAKAFSLARGNPLQYAPDTKIQDRILEKPVVLVQVTLAGGQAGGLVLRPEDIEGLSAQQIKDKFGLPALPATLSEVRIPAGTRIRQGAAALPPGSAGGELVQFELFDRLPSDAIINQKTLP